MSGITAIHRRRRIAEARRQEFLRWTIRVRRMNTIELQETMTDFFGGWIRGGALWNATEEFTYRAK